MATDNNLYDVFISYSSLDREAAKSILGYLEDKGLRCFIDYRDIPPGTPWAAVLPDAIKHSGIMVALCSPNYNQSMQVERELAQADKNVVPLVPFRLTDTPHEGAKSYYFENLNWINGFPQPELVYDKLYSEIVDISRCGKNDWIISRRPGHDHVSVSGKFGSQTYGNDDDPDAPYVIDHTVNPRFEDDYQDALDALRNVELSDAASFLLRPALADYRDSRLKFRQLTQRNIIGHVPGYVWAELQRAADAPSPNGWAEAMLSRYLDFEKDDHDTSYEYAARSAARGDVFGLFELASLYMFGLSVEQDTKKAFEMMSNLARRNFPPAMYNVGREYVNGWSINPNPRRGMRFLQRGADLGDSCCIGEIGWQKVLGEVVERDVEGGIKQLRQALAGGDGTAFDCIVKAFLFDYSKGDYNTGEGLHKVMEELNFGVRKGLSDAMAQLGFLYINGADKIGVKPDAALGLKWLRKAAERGNRDAMWQLGYAYYYGESIPEDNQQAWEWFSKAAARQENASTYMLGQMCQYGHAPEGYAPADAIGYYNTALFLGGYGGNESAKMLFSICSSDGFVQSFPTQPVKRERIKGVMLDDNVALAALKKGAEYNESTCCYLYGCALTDAERPYSNEIEGIRFLEAALKCLTPCYDAALRLSQLYREGIGVARDVAKADEYLDLARKNLDAETMDAFLAGKSPAGESEIKTETKTQPVAEVKSEEKEESAPTAGARQAYNRGLEYARTSQPVEALPLALFWFERAVARGYGSSAERQVASVKKRIIAAFNRTMAAEKPDVTLLGKLMMGSALAYLPNDEAIGRAYREKRGLSLQKKWKEMKEEAMFLQVCRLYPIGRNLPLMAGTLAMMWRLAVGKAAKSADLSRANPCDFQSLIALAESLEKSAWQKFVILFIETKLELRDFAWSIQPPVE